jgi:thiol-disulfide isomerase/thioredoxin
MLRDRYFYDICAQIRNPGMKVRFNFILILLAIWLSQGCKSITGEKVCVHGTFTNLPKSWLYIYQVLPASQPLIDSVSTDASGNFSITFPVKKAGFYILKRNADNEITLIITPGEDIKLTGNGNSLRNSYTVEGSQESKLYSEYNKFTTSNMLKVDSLSRIFAESQVNPDFIHIKKQLDSTYLGIFNNQKEKVVSFVSNHPNSLTSLLVISSNFGPNPLLSEQSNSELFLKLDSALFRAYPENSLVNTFHLRMLDFKAEMADAREHDKILKPGMPALEISLLNASGKEIKLSSTHGKLTLVYFWSSWNALCRQTNMNLASIYTTFHDRGFEIYAVSIDSDADLWKKSYMLDKAYWIQVNDPKGLESDYCKTYAVKAIPMLILVGKDGNIIARDPLVGDLAGLIKKNL